MKNVYVWLLAAVLMLSVTACGNHPKPASDTPSQDTTQHIPTGDTASAHFFPVADWLKGEIAYVDSTPLAIYKYNIVNNHTDSVLIRQQEFNSLAAAFLVPQLAPGSLEKDFTENSFMDKTTGYLTFTYAAKNKDLPLQRVDVLAIARPGNNVVKSAYIETVESSGDTNIVKKMFWTSRQSFVIVDSRQPKGKPALVKQLKVVWDHDSQ